MDLIMRSYPYNCTYWLGSNQTLLYQYQGEFILRLVLINISHFFDLQFLILYIIIQFCFQGDYGKLGHGNTLMQKKPKRVQSALKEKVNKQLRFLLCIFPG